MVLMRASSDEVSSVRIRLRANTGQRLAVEDERGGIHLFLSLDFLPFLLLSFSHDEGRFCSSSSSSSSSNSSSSTQQNDTARLQKVKNPSSISSSSGNKLILLKSTHLKGGMYSYLR